MPVKNRAPEAFHTVMVQFIVNKEGEVTDIKPRFGFGMEEEVIRILNSHQSGYQLFSLAGMLGPIVNNR